MANLMITDVCNLDCSYCFAREHMQSVRKSQSPAFISHENFEARLDFLDRLGIEEARLIGGEPTLHPHFPELVERARQRGKRIAAFSHGVLSEKALECLEAIPVEECNLLVNMNAVGHHPDQERRRRRTVLQRLGPRVLMGYNIYRVDFNADDLISLILEMGCRKAIRLGLAQPSLDGHNECLHPKQYPLVAAKIVQLAGLAHKAGIILEFDCGFVRCMFSEDEIETLHQMGVKTGWHCGPVPDIDLEGQALHCFPLASRITAPIQCIINWDVLIEALSEQTRLYRRAGIYRDCSSCRFKLNGECMGGCLANTLLRFRGSSTQVDLPGRYLTT